MTPNTPVPQTEAGRQLRDAIATYGASTLSDTTAPHVLVCMRFLWGLGDIIDPAILAIEAEAAKSAQAQVAEMEKKTAPRMALERRVAQLSKMLGEIIDSSDRYRGDEQDDGELWNVIEIARAALASSDTGWLARHDAAVIAAERARLRTTIDGWLSAGHFPTEDTWTGSEWGASHGACQDVLALLSEEQS